MYGPSQKSVVNMTRVCVCVCVYLCATLPFLMSEMISGSLGFLLDGAEHADRIKKVRVDFTQKKNKLKHETVNN